MTNEQIDAEREKFEAVASASGFATVRISHPTGSPMEYLDAGARQGWGFWLARAELDPTNQPQTDKTGLAAIMGKWPGDETDEEIDKALAEMKGKRCPECERLMAAKQSASESEP